MTKDAPERHLLGLVRPPRRYPLLGVYDVGLGLILIASPSPRLSSVGFLAPRSVMPLAVWGVILAAIGLLLFLPDQWTFHVLMLGALWCAFWAGSLFYGTRIQPATAFTGPWTYFWVCLVHLQRALARRDLTRPRR